jgi:hypothetical protein
MDSEWEQLNAENKEAVHKVVEIGNGIVKDMEDAGQHREAKGLKARLNTLRPLLVTAQLQHQQKTDNR